MNLKYWDDFIKALETSELFNNIELKKKMNNNNNKLIN